MSYTPTAVYLLKNTWSDSNFKIGFSNYPERRLFEVISSYENVDPRVLFTCWFPSRLSANKAETSWHQLFKDKQTDDHGGDEWFSLTNSNVIKFRDWASQSLDPKKLRLWLFNGGATKEDVSSYTTGLIRSIPSRRSRPKPRVDIWLSPDYHPSTAHVRSKNKTTT